MDSARALALVDRIWEESILPEIRTYIGIPNQSPAYDPDWATNGLMDQVVELAAAWVDSRRIPGLTREVVRLPGRTPLLYLEVPGEADRTVLLYGHLDKQPPMLPWSDGLDPYRAVRRGDRLYGRGAGDDGYAVFGSVAAIEALRDQGIPHARCVVLIETCEESGSFDLPAYFDHLRKRIGKPDLVVCLDSGCGDYERLWVTTSLRGVVTGTLRASVLEEGVHSGDAGGIVPSSFRVLRQVLARLEEAETGRILPKSLHVTIPPGRLRQAGETAAVLGADVHAKFPYVPGMRPVTQDPTEGLLNRTWRPSLAVTGAEGLPSLSQAGNVLRPTTALKLSLRIPPGLAPEGAAAEVRRLLEADPPYGAAVTFTPEQSAPGWDAPAVAGWLEESIRAASRAFFGAPAAYMGEGGTIPFMGMLGVLFPEAQYLITGVLGPGSNAHGPNEYLDIATGKRVTACVARVVADHLRAR
jgi:acetylornithine deacetylase/succinyl-diaminopimelate desuccinylase-like protein